MKAKVSWGAAGLLLGLVAALTLPSLAQTSSPSPGTDGSGRTVTVTGSATIRSAPDEAVVTLGVQTQAPTAQGALQQNASRMNDVVKALLGDGVKPETRDSMGEPVPELRQRRQRRSCRTRRRTRSTSPSATFPRSVPSSTMRWARAPTSRAASSSSSPTRTRAWSGRWRRPSRTRGPRPRRWRRPATLRSAPSSPLLRVRRRNTRRSRSPPTPAGRKPRPRSHRPRWRPR